MKEKDEDEDEDETEGKEIGEKQKAGNSTLQTDNLPLDKSDQKTAKKLSLDKSDQKTAKKLSLDKSDQKTAKELTLEKTYRKTVDNCKNILKEAENYLTKNMGSGRLEILYGAVKNLIRNLKDATKNKRGGKGGGSTGWPENTIPKKPNFPDKYSCRPETQEKEESYQNQLQAVNETIKKWLNDDGCLGLQKLRVCLRNFAVKLLGAIEPGSEIKLKQKSKKELEIIEGGSKIKEMTTALSAQCKSTDKMKTVPFANPTGEGLNAVVQLIENIPEAYNKWGKEKDEVVSLLKGLMEEKTKHCFTSNLLECYEIAKDLKKAYKIKAEAEWMGKCIINKKTEIVKKNQYFYIYK